MDTKKIVLSFVLLAFAGAVAFGQESEIRVYPNPASEYIQVQLSSEFTEAIIEVNSMIGNKVRLNVEELGFGKYRVPLDNLATGYYFIVVKDEKKRFKKAFKILKR